MNFDGFIFYIVGSWTFILVLSAGEFIFSLGYAKRDRFALRYALSILGLLAAAVPLTLVFYAVDELTGNLVLTNVTVVAIYLVMFALSLIALRLCRAETLRSYLICGISGYAAQFVFYNVYGMINFGGVLERGFYTLGRYQGLALSTLMQLAVSGAVLLVIWLIFARPANRYAPDGLLGKTVAMISVAALAIVLVLNAVRNIFMEESPALNVLCGILFIVCCVFIMLLRMGLLEQNRLQHNIDTIMKLHHEERKHYEKLKENIELVNIKCHDIKHYIELAEKRAGIDFDDLKKLVNIYDSDVKTGNETIDTILTERSLYCSAHGIRMSVLADASGLGSMEITDLCSLFGNAVENAIEAVSKCPAEDLRVINVAIKPVAGQVSICVENYFAEPPAFENGQPVSTKGDEANHGYGLKSIRHVTEKYDGTLSCTTDGNIFRLNVMLSLPQ